MFHKEHSFGCSQATALVWALKSKKSLKDVPYLEYMEWISYCPFNLDLTMVENPHMG
jgi:hypothetical protein